MPRIETRVKAPAADLRAMLGKIDGVTVHDLGRDPAAIVSFTLAGTTSAAVTSHIANLGINVSVSAPTSTPVDGARRHPDDGAPHMHHRNGGAQRDVLEAAKRGHEGHANQAPVKHQLKSVKVRRGVLDANAHGRKKKRRQDHP